MVKQFHSVEGFVNDCTTPCLVGSINPYEISKMLFRAGQTYRSTYNVDTTTLSETVESFNNNNNTNINSESQIQQAIKDSLTLYDMETCYQNVYLNTNLQTSIESGDGAKYQLKILIDEVGDSINETIGTTVDSSLYRLRCKINKEGLSDDPKFFVLSSNTNNDGNQYQYLQVTNEEYYTSNAPLDVLSFGNNTNNNNNNKSNTNAREMNTSNTLYFHFYQAYTNAIYIKVFDEENDYGFLTKDMALISEDSIYDSSTFSGFVDDLLNVNYYFIKPYQIPDYSLDIYLESNIQVLGSNNETYVNANIKIEEYKPHPNTLDFPYRLIVQKPDGNAEKLYAFTQSTGSNKITTTDQCSSSANTSDPNVDKYLFTFWQTLDDQFIICKMFQNVTDNCDVSLSTQNTSNNKNNATNNPITDTTSFDLVGVCSSSNKTYELPDISCSSASKELYVVNKTTSGSFRSGVHCNLSNSFFNIEDLETLIEVVELNAKALLIEDLQELDVVSEGTEIPLGSGSNSPKDNTLNLIILLKIVSVIIAAFLFFDFDTTRALPVKLFKLAFTMFFSEFYIIFQFLRYVVWGR